MRQIFAVLAFAALGACASSKGSMTLSPLPPGVAADSRVEAVTLLSIPEGVSGEFRGLFEKRVADKLAACATGARPLRLEASVSKMRKNEPLATWLVGDRNRIIGEAALLDAATGEVLGRYHVRRGLGAGGSWGVLLLAEAEEQMTSAFGDELCRQAFGKGGAPR